MATTTETTETPDTATDAGGNADGAAQAEATQQQLSLLPQVDGKTRTRLRLALSGTVELEVHDDRDAGLVRALALGDKVELELVRPDGGSTGIGFEMGVDDKADKARRSNDGYLEDVVHTIRLRALSISHPAGEADSAHVNAQG